MQALILGDDFGNQTRLAAALMAAGFQVICVESTRAAQSYMGAQIVDVLIVTETRSVRVGQSCACVAHSRNRQVSVLVVTDRTGPATDELFDEVPQLYGVIGFDMPPAMIAGLARASILPPQAGGETGAAAETDAVLPGQSDGAQSPVANSPPGAAATISSPVDAPELAPVVAPVVAPVAHPPIAHPPVAHPPVTAAPLIRTLIQPAQRRVTTGSAASAAWPFVAPRPAPTELAPVLAALERELDLVNRDRPGVRADTAGPPMSAHASVAGPERALNHYGVRGAAPAPLLPLPSVLDPGIADSLSDWLQTAPRLALLTDGTDPATNLPPLFRPDLRPGPRPTLQ